MIKNSVQAKAKLQFSRATPEQVYDAWLHPAKVTTWMAAALRASGLPGEIRRVESDARVGGKFVFSDFRGDEEACHWGTYLELDRPRKIVFTWIVDKSEEANPSTVTIAIEPTAASGCTVSVVHEMDSAWRDYVDRTAEGWMRMLRAIDQLS